MDTINDVRNTLIDLFGKNDVNSLLSDGRKISGLLFDYCPSHRKEIRALMAAYDEHIPEELLKAKMEGNKELLVVRLIQKLLDSTPLSDDSAKWAVRTWAIALNIILVPIEKEEEQKIELVIHNLPQNNVGSDTRHPPKKVAFHSDLPLHIYSRQISELNSYWERIGITPGSIKLEMNKVHGLGLSPLAQWKNNQGKDTYNPNGGGSLSRKLGVQAMQAFVNEMKQKKGISYFDFTETFITDDVIPYLLELPFLEYFDFTGTKISNTGLAYLTQNSNIKSLLLTDCYNIDDNAIGFLSAFPKLTELGVIGCHVYQAGREMIYTLNRLITLAISGGFDDKGIPVGVLTNLKQLYLSSYSSRDIAEILKLMSIEYLHLHGSYHLTDDDALKIRNLKELKFIELVNEHITDKFFLTLKPLVNLEEVRLTYCDNVSDASLIFLGSFPKLKSIHLKGTSKISRQGLIQLLKTNKQVSIYWPGLTPGADFGFDNNRIRTY